MLHSKKSQSILQWFNSLTTKGDVHSLTQFTDGSHFYEIIASLQPGFVHGLKEDNLASESVIFSETSIACNEEVITSVEDEASEGKMETSVSGSETADSFVIKESDDTDTHKKYEIIKNFINNFYHVDSSSFIDYGECQNGKELELAKVAVFLLSAMVQNLLSSEDKVVYNTTLLEPEVQENIRECISLVLVEKDSGENQLKKTELHRILSRPASFKGTPNRKQPSRNVLDTTDLSEGVKNVPKKRRERTSVIVYEDVQDSPLKNLLESPKIQYKAAIFRKDSELMKLRSALHNEENKVIDLTLEKKSLNDELVKRNKELEFYKKELELQREAFCEKDDLNTEEYKNKKLEEERIRKLVETQKEEIKQLQESNEALQEKVVEIEEKLKQDTTSPLIEENNLLKAKIEKLEVDNEQKSETIKSLNEKITDLGNDLKMYQQMYQDFSASASRRELRSPNVPETLSTIIYADEHSSRETLDRKEHELKHDSDIKEERVKRLASLRKGDASKNKKQSVESAQLVPDHKESPSCFEREKALIKDKLEYYETKYGPIPRDSSGVVDLCSTNNERGQLCPTSNNKTCHLWSNLPEEDPDVNLEIVLSAGKIQAERTALVKIIRELGKKNCLLPFQVKKMVLSSSRISNTYALSACLRDLAHTLETQPGLRSITTRRSHSHVTEENINSLMNRNRNLEHELQVFKQNTKSFQSKIENDLKLVYKNVLEEKTKEIETLKQEIVVLQEKYINMQKLVKKKDQDIKKTLIMYQNVKNFKEKMSKQCGKECEDLKRKFKEQNKDCLDLERETAFLKSVNKDLKGQLENLRYSVKELTKEKKELQRKLWIETSALSNNIADRDAVVFHYLSHSKHEPPKTAKDNQFRRNEDQRNSSKPTMKFHRYLLDDEKEPSVSNSMLANRSIQSGFFQAADEDDFLNESSLAEIHNGGIPEDGYGDGRLEEIRRRNTLCLPHLQSCYPLEMQNMTPNEKKYYDPKEVSFDLGRKSSIFGGQKDFSRASKSKYVESDSADSDDSDSLTVRKRKLAEKERVSMPAAKKQCRPAAKIIGPKEKPSTPLKRVAAFVRKQSTFKTPISVHRLMSMPRKSKAH